MKTSKTRKFIVAVWLALSSLMPHSAVQAQQETYAMSEMVYKALQNVQGLIDSNHQDEALQQLARLRESRISEYEKAHTWNMAAFIYFEQERYDEAIDAYRQIISLERIPGSLRQSSLKGLSQLGLMQENFGDAIVYAEELLALQENPDPELYILMGQALYRLERYEEALHPVERAIAMQHESGTSIKENWLLLLNAIHYNRQDYNGMKATLRALIADYPRPSYLLNLAAVYSELDDTQAQTGIMESLYESGNLHQETQLVNLANLYMYHKVPYKAAQLLQKGIDNGTVRENHRNYQYLAQAWQLAGDMERALTPLTRAAEYADTGDTYMQLAQIYFNLTRWREVEESVQNALGKGELKQRGNAYLLLGMSRFNQKRFEPARTAFEHAREEADMAKLAEQWLGYLEMEQSRYAALE